MRTRLGVGTSSQHTSNRREEREPAAKNILQNAARQLGRFTPTSRRILSKQKSGTTAHACTALAVSLVGQACDSCKQARSYDDLIKHGSKEKHLPKLWHAQECDFEKSDAMQCSAEKVTEQMLLCATVSLQQSQQDSISFLPLFVLFTNFCTTMLHRRFLAEMSQSGCCAAAGQGLQGTEQL